MIEPELTLLEMQVEGVSWNAVELGKPSLRIAPEGFDAVDVVVVDAELIHVMTDAKMLGIPYVHQAVVSRPSIAVDDGFQADPSSDNLLQRGFAAVGNDLGVDAIVPLEDPEHDGLSACATTVLATNPAGAEIGFVDLNGSTERRLCLANLREPPSDSKKDVVHRAHIHTGHPCGLARGKVFFKAPQNRLKTTLGNLCNFVIPVNSFHCRSIHLLKQASAS